MTESIKVKNGIRYDLNGWVYVSIKGSPKERGYAYGKLIKNDMKEVRRILDFIIYTDYGVKWDFFIEAARKYFSPKIQDKFPEFFEEMLGFAEGANMNIDEVVAWNNYFTLTEGWWANMPEQESIAIRGTAVANVGSSREGGAPERCSAFIAVGDWTADGKIVCAHNNFSNFADGQLAKYVVDLNPTKGNRMIYQGAPGYISSQTDFFVTSAGIIGTETTIGGFISYKYRDPIVCRIRHAMQYGKNLDDYVEILTNNNSGDYANSWLFGDIKTNEIMRIELGVEYVNVERTKNGYFIGFNAAYDPRIRNLECINTGFDDIRRHQGARKVRLEQLMEQNKGKIDTNIAKEIIADHYDVYLNKINPSSRTCCSHYDLDDRAFMSQSDRPKPYEPRGALDGAVCDSSLAKNMSFIMRWGSSCGIAFDKEDFVKRNAQWKRFGPYLHDRQSQPWTLFKSNEKYIFQNKINKINKINKTTRNKTTRNKTTINKTTRNKTTRNKTTTNEIK